MRKRGPLVAALLTIALLGGCASEPAAVSRPHTSAKQEAPAGFQKYYDQKVDWQQCTSRTIVHPMMNLPADMQNYQCAMLIAPMNWDDPTSEPIELGVARYTPGKKGDQLPALFYNLGGPGGGSVDSIVSVVENIWTDKVARNFQTIALDPRGVGLSTPISCLTDAEKDEEAYEVVDLEGMTAQQIVDLYEDETELLGAKCLQRSGEVLGYVDSESAARDFDMVRAALGFAEFDYVGFSYGTLLGAIYADLFPQHVRHFVLDGVLDPALNANEVSALQLEGMEASLYHWMESCQETSGCPLPDDFEDAKQWMINFIEETTENPIPTGERDRPLSGNLAYTAVIGSLYSTDTYELLTDGMIQAADGDASTLLFLADFFNDREVDGTYSTNGEDAFVAINYLDYEPAGTVEEWEAASKDLGERFPVLGPDFGYSSAGLNKWPVESRWVRQPIYAKDAPEMLLIGTTHDPATPYVMAESLHEAIDNSVLLTVDSWEHTAYSRDASTCVTSIVDEFLLTGALPADGTVCD